MRLKESGIVRACELNGGKHLFSSVTGYLNEICNYGGWPIPLSEDIYFVFISEHILMTINNELFYKEKRKNHFKTPMNVYT